ncbi:CD82 antigen-like [Antennarius striatus]|uniref:CD82 antigen-like n=1 Tax=Antennarius striatus TaxID=241820 RepID=UPI0035B41E96
MGKVCFTMTKYLAVLFNFSFFIFGALIIGFGIWIRFDNLSSIAVLKESSESLKVISYFLIGVGFLLMFVDFFGCFGAIYEIRCLLGLYFICLLFILIAQIASGVLMYVRRDGLQYEMSKIFRGMIFNYSGQNRTTELALDNFQRKMQCCGWTGPDDWSENIAIRNSSLNLYSCSCRNQSLPGPIIRHFGLCEHLSADPPVYETGCMSKVGKWLLDNCGVILAICVGVAFVEVLGMILSIYLCKNVNMDVEDYAEVQAQ